MKLIVGLGNIGKEYDNTRHNVGFKALDQLLDKYNITLDKNKFDGYYTKTTINGEQVILLKPAKYMNLSGEAVIAVMNYYKIPIEDLLVVYDDLSLELGRIRFRPDGSDGGHNGIKSIIKHLGTSDFARLKIGIGPQPPIPAEEFVLQNFYKSQLDILKPTLKKAVEGVEFYFDNDMQKAQNYYN